MLINNTATPAASNPITGTFTNLPQGGTISASYGGTTYYSVNYAGGDGNDLVLTNELAPSVTGISPAAGPLAGGTSVTITGTNLAGATAVKFGATAVTTFFISNTGTQIVVNSPAGSAGTVDVTVVTPGGASPVNSPADQFSYAAAPSGDGHQSDVGPAAGGTSVTITGTGFTGATAVDFGTTAATNVMVKSATQITATSPAGTGTVDVTVVTPGGASPVNSPADQFSYVAAPTTVGLYDPATSTFYLRNTNRHRQCRRDFRLRRGRGRLDPHRRRLGWQRHRHHRPLQSADLGLLSAQHEYCRVRRHDLPIWSGRLPAGSQWMPIAGDWDGDGTDTIGLYNPVTSMFYLRNTNDSGYADVTFAYGPAGAGWMPIAGDWDGDGKDTIGLYNPATSVFYLAEHDSLQGPNDMGYADVTFAYGPAGAGWKPIAGDWNGDGKDTIGLYDPTRPSSILRNTIRCKARRQGLCRRGFCLWRGRRRLVADRRRLERSRQALMAAGGSVAASANAAGARARPISSRLSTRPSLAGPAPAWTPPPWRNSRRSSLSSAICRARIWARPKGTGSTSTAMRPVTAGSSIPRRRLDEEFTPSPSNQQLQAIDPRAVDRIDLLTVVEHELGHVAGLGDLDASVNDLMSGMLGAGVRRNASHVDAVMAS